jgi:hypothetical protein
MAAHSFQENTMPEGLTCALRMPLAWHAVQLDPHTRQSRIVEAALLLNALNQMESSHEMDAGGAENRRLDRIEAKLDLTLFLLARRLETSNTPVPLDVQLTPSGAQWPDPAPPAAGSELIVEFQPSETLPLSLRLPAVALDPGTDQARVSFEGLSETLDEALYQFVFRRHRQAIRARTT